MMKRKTTRKSKYDFITNQKYFDSIKQIYAQKSVTLHKRISKTHLYIQVMKQTKIVASISDRRCDIDFIRKLFFAGMNVVRMNTAHATPDGIRTIIRNVRAVSPHIALMIDTKGPEVRTTGVESPIEYKTGDMVKIFGRPEMDSSHDIVNVSYPDFARDVKVGDHVLFDDGELDMLVVENVGPMLVAQVQNDGVLGAHKSVNVPGEHIALPAITEKDRQNILLAIEEDIDFIAHSFVRSAADVMAIQQILDENNSDIKIISKIENQEGVDNIDEIIDASYGIMIARGDLGIEVPIERIPGIQRQIIRKCVMKKKPVIVATQMLHTMIKNPRPTRAEVTDFGAFIDLGGVDGLLHISEMSWGRTENPKKVYKIGDSVKCFIKEINGDKIALSVKYPDLNPWNNAAEKYAVGNVVKGTVARMTDFGAFVQLEDGIDALLHVSQISRDRIEKPSDALSIGQEIEAKVVDLNEADKKISLSIKALLNDNEAQEEAPATEE